MAEGVNLFELQARSDRLTMDLARKHMATDVLRTLLETKNLSCAQSIEAVIALCDLEAKK